MNKSNTRAPLGGSVFRRSFVRNLALAVGVLTCSTQVMAQSNNGSTSATYALGGTVTGLTSPGLILSNNGVNRLIHAGATVFKFGTFPQGTSYDVTITRQPQAQVCDVTNGTGTLSATPANITVSCSEKPRWSWMTGSDAVYASGDYGTQGVASPGNTPGARYESVSWTDAYGKLWLFGGLANSAQGSGYVNDLWKFDPADNQWTWVKGSSTTSSPGVYGTLGVAAPNNVPGGRVGSNEWTDYNGDFWIFGGLGIDATGNGYFLNDFWKYDPETNEWTAENNAQYNGVGTVSVCGVQGVANSTDIPGPRFESVSWRDGHGNFWLFGGYGCDANNNLGDLNDMWKYNMRTNTWTRIGGSQLTGSTGSFGVRGVAATTNFPSARQRAASWVDSYGNFWLFGGEGVDAHGASYVLNDLWKFDIITKTWTWVSGSDSVLATGVYGTRGVESPANVPGARSGAVSWFDKAGDFWMFGGWGTDSTGVGVYVLSDLWKYNPSTNMWTWMSGPNVYLMKGIYGTQGIAATDNIPGARYEDAAWIDNDRNLWLFGGSGIDSTGASGFLNDMWKYDLN